VHISNTTIILDDVDGCVQSSSQQWHLIMNKETNKAENYYLCV